MGRVREKSRREKIREEKELREKVGKSRNTVFFQWFMAPDGESKSRLAKAAGAKPSGQMRDEKIHALVARSTFRSQHVQYTPFSDHFWKLRCRKSARCCGAKHMSKSKCTKHTRGSDHFLKLRPRKSARRGGAKMREAHFEVKMLKTPGFGPLLDIQMSFRVASAKDCASSQQ